MICLIDLELKGRRANDGNRNISHNKLFCRVKILQLCLMQIHLAVADEVADVTGEYFSDCKVVVFPSYYCAIMASKYLLFIRFRLPKLLNWLRIPVWPRNFGKSVKRWFI